MTAVDPAAEREVLGYHRTEPALVTRWDPPAWTAGRDDVVSRNDNGIVSHSLDIGEFRVVADFLDENGEDTESLEGVAVSQVDHIDVFSPGESVVPYIRVERQPATITVGSHEMSPLAALHLVTLINSAVRVLLGPDAALLRDAEREAYVRYVRSGRDLDDADDLRALAEEGGRA